MSEKSARQSSSNQHGIREHINLHTTTNIAETVRNDREQLGQLLGHILADAWLSLHSKPRQQPLCKSDA